MSLSNIFLLVMACVLAIACASVAIKGQLSKPAKNNEVETLLVIEYVPTAMSRLETKGFTASAMAQTELLVAGGKLLEKLPFEISDCLSAPVSGNLAALFEQGGNYIDLFPERVVAAAALAEVSLVLWDLMFEFKPIMPSNPHHQAILGERMGFLTVGKQNCGPRYMPRRISHKIGVSEAVATAMWAGIVAILREGKVNIPGLKATKQAAQTSDGRV